MGSVSEKRRIANREANRRWYEKNKEAKNRKSRERERNKKEDSLFAAYGFRVIPDGMKKCSMCEEVKLLECFYARRPTKTHKQTHRSWCKDCDSEAQKITSPRKVKYHKDWKLRTRFGITLQQYEQMSESQGHKCAICERHISELARRCGLCVDHCHKTGVVRGLLCSDCNIGIGKLGDDVHGVQRAVTYLLGVRSK